MEFFKDNTKIEVSIVPALPDTFALTRTTDVLTISRVMFFTVRMDLLGGVLTTSETPTISTPDGLKLADNYMFIGDYRECKYQMKEFIANEATNHKKYAIKDYINVPFERAESEREEEEHPD